MNNTQKNQRFSRFFVIIIFVSVCILSVYISLNIKNKAVAKQDPILSTPITTETPPDPVPLRIAFVGDMMFDRAVRKAVLKHGYGYVFGEAPNFLPENDLVVGNLEGPITDSPSHIIRADGTTNDSLQFTFPTSTAASLRELGVGIVSLANNHTDNMGQDGLEQTKRWLNQSGIRYFGSPTNDTDISTIVCTQDHYCLGLIGYHQFSYKNEDLIIQEIQKLKQNPDVGLIVVFPHWGEEYQHNPTPFQVAHAHAWIDAGADLIIGAHPHVVQTIETYKDKTIFYSLGNFIFDQYFSFDTTHGLVVQINTEPKTRTYTYKIRVIQNTGLIVRTATPEDTARVLESTK